MNLSSMAELNELSDSSRFFLGFSNSMGGYLFLICWSEVEPAGSFNH